MPPDGKLLRVVADTNVVFSALALPKDSPPTHVLALARARRIRLIMSPWILEELESNLRRRAQWDEPRLAVLHEQLTTFVEFVTPHSRLRVITRVDADNRILECALDANADVLVTGNLKDLRPLGAFRGIPILTPREFIDTHFPDGV